MEKKLRVLICDDSVLIRKKMRGILEKCKCGEVFEAESGDAAIELVKLNNLDIVFMDIVMPNKDGLEALKEIMEIDPKVKVVMASSVGTSANLKEAIKHGAYDFIQKPVSFEAVANVIEKVLKEE